MRKLLALCGLLCSAGLAFGQAAVQQSVERFDVNTNVGFTQAAAGSQSVLTITPPGGQYVYLTGISIDACVNNTGGTVVTNQSVTATGIIGAPGWQFSNPGTANTCAQGSNGVGPVGYGYPANTVSDKFTTPLRSSVPGTAVVFTSPTTANVAYAIRAYYYFAP